MSNSILITPIFEELTEDDHAEPLDADVQHLATPEDVEDKT